MDTEAKQSTPTDAELIKRVGDLLKRYIQHETCASLTAGIDYALFGGGKRIRPILCFRSYQAVGGLYEGALPAAAAIELIHTFSLVHDDLPAMDDDDFRRGRPTLHKHTNEAMAILAGDAMTALAFRLIASEVGHPDISQKLTTELASATFSMIVGQVHDTMDGYPEHFDDVIKMRLTHMNKTGALLRASVAMGAISGRASKEQIHHLDQYAINIGLMFQAVDDLLDVTQSAEKMGKATGKDAGQGKLTYPGLLGVDGTRAEIHKLLSQALDALSGFDVKADPLREMANKLATREH